jgi:hypothetical protein
MPKRLVLAVLTLAAFAVLVPLQFAAATTVAACHPALKSVALVTPSVPGGASDKVTVVLSCAAPSAVKVQLRGFKGVSVPASVVVARRKASAAATVRTAATRAARHGDIQATLGRTHRDVALTVTRTPPSCRSPRLTALSLPDLTYVGSQVAATIRLTCAPISPIRVSLSSSSSYLPVPATVTVGRYYDALEVPLTPKADELGQFAAKVTARYSSRTLSRTITIDPGLASFTIPSCSEPNCVDPDALFTGVIPTGGYTVHLASSNAAVTVPATVTFQAGSLGGGFNATVNTVTQNTVVTLSATFAGRTLRASTTILAPWNSSDGVTLSAEAGPGPVYGQEFDLEYQVLLSNPAPASGETVTFSSPSSAVELQATSTEIVAGTDNGYVDINTADVTSPVHTELDAVVDGVQASLPIVIEPGLSSFTDVPTSVTGGEGFTATLNLAGPVDTATTVGLQSTDGVLSVPATVVVPAGQSSVSFKATTVQVSSDTNATIYAYLGNGNINSSTVTITPPS